MLKTQLMNKKKPLYLWSLHSSYEWQENEEKIKDIECWQLLYGKWKQCISERNWMGRSVRAYIQGSLSEKVTFKLKLERRTKQEFHREKEAKSKGLRWGCTSWLHKTERPLWAWERLKEMSRVQWDKALHHRQAWVCICALSLSSCKLSNVAEPQKSSLPNQ